MAKDRIRKTQGLTLGVLGLLASATLTGCDTAGNEIDADYAQVCRETPSEIRVDDTKCSEEGRAGGHYGWYFYNMTGGQSTIAPVGSKVSGGSTTAPSSGTVKSGVTSKGGTVSRGGFGGSASGNNG